MLTGKKIVAAIALGAKSIPFHSVILSIFVVDFLIVSCRVMSCPALPCVACCSVGIIRFHGLLYMFTFVRVYKDEHSLNFFNYFYV